MNTAAFLTQTVCLDDTTVKFEIWDTAGQERYHSLAPMYYRGAQAAIVVYDITNQVRKPVSLFVPDSSLVVSGPCLSALEPQPPFSTSSCCDRPIARSLLTRCPVSFFSVTTRNPRENIIVCSD